MFYSSKIVPFLNDQQINPLSFICLQRTNSPIPSNKKNHVINNSISAVSSLYLSVATNLLFYSSKIVPFLNDRQINPLSFISVSRGLIVQYPPIKYNHVTNNSISAVSSLDLSVATNLLFYSSKLVPFLNDRQINPFYLSLSPED